MRKLTLLLILVFALSACFKDAGSDTPTAQPISLVSNSGSVVQPSLETPQVSPTIEMVITEEATEAAATPTEEATEVVFVATATATEFVPPSLTPTQVIISTATATATVTQASVFIPVGPQPTLTMIGSGQGGAGEETEAIPLGEPTQEMFNATQIAMAQATSTPTLTNTPIPTNTLLPTATQTPQPTNTAISTTAPAGSQFGQPTLTTIPLIAVQPSTATPDFGTGGALATVEVAQLPTQQGLTVNQMTATAVIQNATATANAIFAIQTQQAGGAVVASPQVVTPGATIQVQPTIATTDCAYLVPLGETLSEIARRYNLTIDQIANYNSIT
ncbi:MAG: LysM peptidoglycan-binding domain-containing protein, partial [Anaerolineae bacterium]|nr:LysM peptidoglycan-binding domain-containing protein [Anaerolineae bacterium]